MYPATAASGTSARNIQKLIPAARPSVRARSTPPAIPETHGGRESHAGSCFFCGSAVVRIGDGVVQRSCPPGIPRSAVLVALAALLGLAELLALGALERLLRLLSELFHAAGLLGLTLRSLVVTTSPRAAALALVLELADWSDVRPARA